MSINRSLIMKLPLCLESKWGMAIQYAIDVNGLLVRKASYTNTKINKFTKINGCIYRVYQDRDNNQLIIKKRIFFFLNRFSFKTDLHLVRRFWNHVFTWASVILSSLASAARSADAKYFCLWNRFSNSHT